MTGWKLPVPDREGWWRVPVRLLPADPAHPFVLHTESVPAEAVYVGTIRPLDLPPGWPERQLPIDRGYTYHYHSPASWRDAFGHDHQVWVWADAPCRGTHRLRQVRDCDGFPTGLLRCNACPPAGGWAELPEEAAEPPV